MKKGLGLGLLVTTLLLTGCAPKEENNSLLSASKIHQVNTKQKLSDLIKEGKEHSSVTWANYGNIFLEDVMAGTPVPEANPESGAMEKTEEKRDYVGTNLQDAAVDESDIIKTDGNNIYYINQGVTDGPNKFTVFNVTDDHKIIKTKEIVEPNVVFSEMYLLSDYVVLVGSETTNSSGVPEYMMSYYYNRGSAIYIYDIKKLEIVYTLELNYSITTTRVIDQALYIVGHKPLGYQNDNEMPVKIENGEEATLDYTDIYYFDDTPAFGITLIGGLLLDSDPAKISYAEQGYLGAAYAHKNVYVNQNNLYISDSTYYYGKMNSYNSLTISQFALSKSDATATFVGAGNVKGAALNQFAMDEHNGYLRLATTDNEATWNINIAGEGIWETYKVTKTNYLYILKMDIESETFKLVGHISEGLGKPDEDIRSVRFAGDKGYIVTFKQTDPLYVIDLKDAKNPVVTDALELPGFDTYQHPWSENSLIGLGNSATEMGVVDGIKLTAYDTTSGSAKVLQTLKVAAIINNRFNYTSVYSEALYNHKAMLVSPAHNLFGFPIYSYTYSFNSNSGNNDYLSEYLLYKIDFENRATPITELARITHEKDVEQRNEIRRAVLIEGFIYTFAHETVATYDIANNIIGEKVLTF